MNTGSPTASVEVNKVAYLLKGGEEVILPLPTQEELFAVLCGAMEKAKPHLRYICRKTYGEQFPGLPLIEAKTKCLCFKFREGQGMIEHLVVTRNGAIFLLQTWNQIRSEIEPKAIILTQEMFSSLNRTEKKGWLQIVFCAVQGLRQELASQAHFLRERAKEQDRVAEELLAIEGRLNAL